MLQMFYQTFSDKFLNSTSCAVYCVGAFMFTGPAETTIFGPTFFWSSSLTSLSTHTHIQTWSDIKANCS